MEWALLIPTILSIILIQTTDVAALTSNSDIIGIAVAGCASFSLLALVIGMLIASCNWRVWFGRWMRQQGKIRMPERYFKKKKGETKQRLVSGSQRVIIPQMNGHLPRPVVDREKFVQGWRQGNPSVSHRIYEEKDATVELDEEEVGEYKIEAKVVDNENVRVELDEDVDDEFKIEAEVVDNEILDVGPFKQDHSNEIPVKGDVYPEPYIYSAVGSTKRSVRSVGNSVKPASDSRTSAIVGDISGRSVGNSVKQASDSRTSATVGDVSDRSVGNSVKPANDPRSWGVVTKSNGTEYYMAGTNKDKKFEEGLLYM